MGVVAISWHRKANSTQSNLTGIYLRFQVGRRYTRGCFVAPANIKD